MAGDDMAAELIAKSKRALEIDVASFFPSEERGVRQRLIGSFDRDDRALLGLLNVDQREAAAIAGERGALFRLLCL